ncbi:MAG: thiamine pyrophosphate-binding protein [Acidobacteria bacterium]|nr:MAG: thiamine pyrophosphate-binding protein [Acidobacteriota bacterium]
MKKSEKSLVDRRKFLKGAAVGGVATLVASSGAARGQQSLVARSAPAPAIPPIPRPEADPTAEVSVLTADRTGSDFMVDVIKSLGFEYVAANPGSSFRALHESLVNYGGNKNPEFITCCHEESSVALAQGYSAVEGKPMMVMAHSTVGLQHASMGIYNAWAGRAPVFIVLGNTVDAAERRPGVEWDHSAQDAAAMVRDYTKWDDVPASLPHFAESAVRAYRIAVTPPREPVVLVADSTLQESPIQQNASFHIPKLVLDAAPQGDSGSVAEAAKLLVEADNPVVIAGHVVRSQTSMQQFIEFAEALQIPVIDQGGNLPSRHPLNQSLGGRGLIANADVILGLNVEDLWGALHNYRDQLHRSYQSITRTNAKLITITTGDLYLKSNYQDFQRLQDVDLAMAADPEVTLPSLTEAIKRLTTDDRKRMFQDRSAKLAAAGQKAAERARVDASYGWDASPISIPRLSAEVWAAVKTEDWAGGIGGVEWNYDRYYQRTRLWSAAGVGFQAPAAVGAALAQRKNGRLYVHQQNDGDLMYAPGVLWTAAHHRIPMLWVMHNNRAYHQEVMHLQRMANRHQRGIESAGIGTTLLDPNIDYAKLAQSMGWYAEGPISDPKDLGPALRRAVDVVKRGQPALLDTVTQPR